MQLLNQLVQGTDLLVLVIGESGCGKTTLLNRYLVTTDESWKADSYLQYRPALAGYTGESLFKPSDIIMIHKKSNGLPGRMNEHASRWLEKNMRLIHKRRAFSPC